MERKAGWATVHVVIKESDMTEQLTHFLLGIGRKKEADRNKCAGMDILIVGKTRDQFP